MLTSADRLTKKYCCTALGNVLHWALAAAPMYCNTCLSVGNGVSIAVPLRPTTATPAGSPLTSPPRIVGVQFVPLHTYRALVAGAPDTTGLPCIPATEGLGYDPPRSPPASPVGVEPETLTAMIHAAVEIVPATLQTYKVLPVVSKYKSPT